MAVKCQRKAGDRVCSSIHVNAGSGPPISVGMPVYNGEEFVAQAIQSILGQTYEDFELIISDNASNDQTESICRDFASADSRIRYYRNPENIGAAGNYNLLVELARGEYFRWSNADDLIAPTLHEECLKKLTENPQAVLSYGKTVIIDNLGSTIRHYEDNLHLPQSLASERFMQYFENVGLTNAIYGLMRTCAVRQTRIFGDGTLPAGDQSFMAELTLHGTFVEIPTTLFYRRMHPGASSSDRADDERQQNFWRAEATPFKLATIRQNLRYLRRAWMKKIGFAEKFRISLFILRRLVWQRSRVAAELVAVFRRS